MDAPLLEVTGLTTYFFTPGAVVKAVDNVAFSVMKGEVLGIVGESGCGKTMTALSLLRLVPSPPGRIVSGKISCLGKDILALPEKEMRHVRGKVISMIFQEPLTSLNPVFTIGYQIREPLQIHLGLGKNEARERAVAMLSRVGIPDPSRRVDSYPHELSGGMRQRAMIAMALSTGPDLLIADEPTTALDVTIQAQILNLMEQLQAEIGMSVIFITHDMGLVAEIADRVMVMYAGEAVEECSVSELFASPKHPYTIALLNSLPSASAAGRKRLSAIPGIVPDLSTLDEGCHFRDRCPLAEEACSLPQGLRSLSAHRAVRCWKAP